MKKRTRERYPLFSDIISRKIGCIELHTIENCRTKKHRAIKDNVASES